MGRQAAQISLLKRAFKQVSAGQATGGPGASGSTRPSATRSSKKNYQEHQPRHADIELLDRLQRLELQDSKCGYRRLGRELRRQGYQENAKRVLRLMRLDNLLCVRKKRFVLATDSDYFLLVYPNLAARLVVDGLNQLWPTLPTFGCASSLSIWR